MSALFDGQRPFTFPPSGTGESAPDLPVSGATYFGFRAR